MKKLQLILQIFLGLVFLIFGLNKFLGFITMPELNQTATNYMISLGSSGYMFPVIGILEVVCGLALMTNRYVTLSLLLLVPITFNILGFHLFLDPSGLPLSLILTSIHLYFLYERRENYKTLLKN